ncbi:hypothetical protein H9P43_006897 [Blastocladiella emersonii ATCC 22665]|nr:hypothetical protein H9P43_006897 [Blastocladiella emersonii ATCC 22665]
MKSNAHKAAATRKRVRRIPRRAAAAAAADASATAATTGVADDSSTPSAAKGVAASPISAAATAPAAAPLHQQHADDDDGAAASSANIPPPDGMSVTLLKVVEGGERSPGFEARVNALLTQFQGELQPPGPDALPEEIEAYEQRLPRIECRGDAGGDEIDGIKIRVFILGQTQDE